MLLQKSLKKLIASSGATSLRFWGKIKGTEKDYFIAEGTQEAGEAGEGEEGSTEVTEPRGQGVNKFVYWVCNSPLGEWTQLPDLKPSNIMSARHIKHTFSGDVSRLIYTNPFYFAEEKIYLRVQIARISACCTLTPKGLYRFVEDTQERELEDNANDDGEIPKPTVTQMCSLDMWLHKDPSILK